MVPFGGWEMPVSYPAGIIAEHLAVRSSAGLFDIGHMGLIQIRNTKYEIRNNDGALELIQRLATNNASKLEINQCQYSVLCNENGGVIDDILVYRFADHYMIIANASNADRVLSHLKASAGGIDVSRWQDRCALSIQGPQAVGTVEKVLSVSLSTLKRNHVLVSNGMIFSRTGYTGEDGIELVVEKAAAPKIWDLFINANVQPCGLGARDTLRLEAGLPLYGHEYDEETTPLEAGYGWAVKFDKGEFLGKQALEKEKAEGLRKRLVGVELDGREIPRQGYEIFDVQGAKLGVVTSGTFSPSLKKPIALAYLTPHPPYTSPIFISIRGEKRPGKIVDKAFYKRVK
jgi:aminomethyltransferase